MPTRLTDFWLVCKLHLLTHRGKMCHSLGLQQRLISRNLIERILGMTSNTHTDPIRCPTWHAGFGSPDVATL